MPNSPVFNGPIYTKVYRKRWYMLFVFVYYGCLNGIQMTEYSSITDIVSRYYNVSHFTVNWTSLVYMCLYPVLVIPASYIIEAKGLRVASLCGCLGTIAGTIIKLFSIGRDKFWLVLFGQTVAAASQVFIICLPPKIAAVWFKPSEVSLACSLGSLGPSLGNAFGYLLTVLLVSNDVNLRVEENLKILCWMLVALGIPVALSVICYFPSGNSQGRHRASRSIIKEETSFFRNLTYPKGFFIHLLAYAVNIGVLSTVMILLSEFVDVYFENAAEDAGRIGFSMMVFGLLGTVIFGIFLDKTHKYKQASLFIYITSTLSMMMLTVALEKHCLIGAYVFCSIFGIVINPYIPVGFEFGIELTYPKDESTVAGLLFATSQIVALVFAITVSHINSYFGSLYGLITLVALLTFGTLVEFCVPNKLERQRIFKLERHHQINEDSS